MYIQIQIPGLSTMCMIVIVCTERKGHQNTDVYCIYTRLPYRTDGVVVMSRKQQPL